MVGEGLVDEGQDGLGDLLAPFQVVVAVGEDFWLDDRHDPVGLADGGVAGQHVGVLEDGLVGWGLVADLQDATPLGEVAAVLLVLGATFGQVIQT